MQHIHPVQRALGQTSSTRSYSVKPHIEAQRITRQQALARTPAARLGSLRTINAMSPKQHGIFALAGAGQGPCVVEVSEGDFMGDAVFGISVYHSLPGLDQWDFELSLALHSWEDVEAYLEVMNGAGGEDK